MHGTTASEQQWHLRVRQLIEDVARLEGFEVQSWLDVAPGQSWAAQMADTLKRVDVVVADISRSNSNVWYDLGMAAASGLRTLLLASSAQELPFDMASRSIVRIDQNPHTNREWIALALRAMIQRDEVTTGVVAGPFGSTENVAYQREQPPISVTIYNGPVFQGPVTVSGGASFVAQDNSQLTVNIQAGDTQGLSDGLLSAGLPAYAVEALLAALEADRADGHPDDEPGPNVQRWWTRLTLGSRSVAGKVAIGASGGVIAKLIEAYYGMR